MTEGSESRLFYYDFCAAIQCDCDYLTDEEKVDRIKAMLAVLTR